MSHKREGYFTIGEVSKMMGVNAKSLRYYDKIGVLVPALTDPETGYRYYKSSQLGILSAIQICVELGIPLHEFSSYCSNGEVQAGRFLDYAWEKSQQKLRALEESIAFIENLKEQATQSDKLLQTNQMITYDRPKERYIIKEISVDISLPAFNKVLGELHEHAALHGFRPGIHFGKMALFHHGKLERLFAFNAVSLEANGENIVVLPPARYAAIHATSSKLAQAPDIFASYFNESSDMLVLEAEMISSLYSTESPNYEIRCTSIDSSSIQRKICL